jgi:hypothetical protein
LGDVEVLMEGGHRTGADAGFVRNIATADSQIKST